MHRKLLLPPLLLTISLVCISGCIGRDTHFRSGTQVYREDIEWCNVWIPSVNKTDLPKVLMVGDSITKHYYKSVEKELQGKAYCANLTTSTCVADPLFIVQLQSVIEYYDFDVIHFNNGLHGFEYTEEEYRQGYKAALALIRDKLPEARIIIALSTPTKEGGGKECLIPRIQERNRIASELAKSINAPVNDLSTLMKGHPEYYTDDYHFCAEAIDIQAKQVTKLVRNKL